MASTIPLAEDPRKSIEEDGVFCIEDPVVGKRVDEITQKRFPFKTIEGLDFCKVNTLDDKRIRSLVEFFFPRSTLGFYKVFGHKAFDDGKRAFCVLDTEGDGSVQVLVVQLWSSGSRIGFYRKPHHSLFEAVPAKIGLLEIPDNRKHLFKYKEVDMKDGGITIMDAGRLSFAIVKGKTIMFGFATQEESKQWDKMHLPNEQNLKQKVAEMKSATIGIDFDFVD